ncbi:MAG: WecB/TagA/CpsF family glycosyltransferase [Bacteroidales bacterium]|nr:WecB/TagA/CpsF family glycosyltransferase [Bacteroidales bacterium]
MDTINIWDIKINPLSKSEIVNIIDEHISRDEGTFHLTGVNPETIVQAQELHGLKNAINASNMVNIDNMLVVTTLRLLKYKVPERAACPDIFDRLLDLANRKNYSVFFLGAKEEILQLMIKKLNAKYPKLNIVGIRNGYFNSIEELSIVKTIGNLKPDMLFIALPTPQKELFINNYKNSLNVRFAFGVGGAFDCIAEKVKRAPEWMRNIGLEGFHRAIQDPLNYGKRYVKFYLPFLKLFFKELFRKKVVIQNSTVKGSK